MSHEKTHRNNQIYLALKEHRPWREIMLEHNLKSSKSIWLIKQRYERRLKKKRV